MGARRGEENAERGKWCQLTRRSTADYIAHAEIPKRILDPLDPLTRDAQNIRPAQQADDTK